MEKINYRSDIDFILPYPMWTEGEDGKPAIKDIGFPEFDFEVRLWTARRGRSIAVACVGGRCCNCFNDGGRIHVVCNSHGLTPGRLTADYHSMLPDAIYPDGIRDLFRPMELDVELVVGAGDCPTEVEVEAVLPVIRGKDAYTYAVEHGYEGTEAEFGQSLAKVSDKQDSLEVSEDLSLSDGRLSVTERAKREVFNDMWADIGGVRLDNGKYRMVADGKELTYEEAIERYNLNGMVEAWNEAFIVRDPYGREFVYGRYNESTCFFEGNGINDITKAQAMQILELGKPSDATFAFASAYRRLRTNIPIFSNRSGWGEAFFGNSCLEVVNLGRGTYTLTGNYAFYACSSLRSIIGVLRSSINNVINQCPALVDVTIAFTKAGGTFNLGGSPHLSVSSIGYTVTYSSACTLIVHKNVYAKLTGDTTNEAAAALSEEEAVQWQQVFTDAAAKNITFATT